MLGRGARIVARQLKVLGACVLFSTIYGAVYGAALGSLLGIGCDTLLGFGLRTARGALFGAVAGGMSGIIGSIIGGPLGWCVAGALAAMSPFVFYGKPWTVLQELQLIVPIVIPILLGGYIGRIVGSGLRVGRSRLPGVEQLSRAIHADSPPKRPARTRADPTEATPSRAPKGRGDETAPARPVSSG